MTSFRLVYGDYEFALPLGFAPEAEDALVALLRQAEEESRTKADLEKKIVAAITSAFNGDPAPPTEKQLKYALSICKELGLQLPADCIQIQDSMRTFLTRYAPEYQRRKAYRS